MREYTFADIPVGLTESFSRTVTAEMLDAFREVSGDTNPLHCDEAYAQAEGYPSRVVYGMLTASFYSTLVGLYLPGKYALFQELETSFRAPVFVGDELTVTGEVIETRDTFKRITVKAVIKNQNGKTVSKATIKAGVLR